MSTLLTWDTHEHHHDEKSSDWYWSMGIIVVAIAILCILLNNILFAVFILLAAVTAGLHAGRAPKLIHIELTPKGIVMEHKFFPFRELDSFWVEEHEHMQPAIIIKSKKFFMPFIVIPIGRIAPEEVREYLLHHLKEIEHHESIFHRIFEYFGF